MTDQERKDFLERLYQKYSRILFNKSFAMFDYRPEFRQQAEDCVQETFVRAFLEADTLSEYDEPLYWLLTACKHIAMSERRKQRRRRQILNAVPAADEESLADPQDAIADWMAENDLLAKKDQLMETLTAQEREVYSAVYRDALTAKETAARTGTTEGGVYAALRRIRKKIRQLFLSLLLLLSRIVRL